MTNDRPMLAYTRKYGWVVVVPYRRDWPDRDIIFGFVRPGAAKVYKDDVLATAPLPPVPEEAA